jgi:RNA polymerase sigma-70 factor (ECF subfamily)
MLAMTHPEPAAARERLSLDAEEFRAFYAAALPRVYGFHLRRCGSVAVAEDLTQETFAAAVAELKKARRVDDPISWIFGIARHKLLDHYRRQARSRVGPSADPADAASAEHRHEDGDGRAASALAAIPRDQRLALVLRHVDDLSVPEIAAVFGRSVEAVESLLARGRVGFRRAYLEGTG